MWRQIPVLFDAQQRFTGLPRESFELFSIRTDAERRRAIVEQIHPSLELLAGDLLTPLNERASKPLHAHLPRLDWPRGYRPFCTWLALSRESHGYQSGAQLNVGVHAEHVSVRMGWDGSADAFGRFEFLARHGELGRELAALVEAPEIRYRVFASAPWPTGSRCIHESADLPASFDRLRQAGVWWEVGRRYDLPAALEHLCSPAFGADVLTLFGRMLPVYEHVAGDLPHSEG